MALPGIKWHAVAWHGAAWQRVALHGIMLAEYQNEPFPKYASRRAAWLLWGQGGALKAGQTVPLLVGLA
eukprot:11200731-Lingulodinium_polyedra.AAC.1